MPRQTLTFPKKFWNELEQEAKRRITEANAVGRRMLGSVIRDIILICCYEKLNLLDVSKMSKQEFQAVAKKWKKLKK